MYSSVKRSMTEQRQSSILVSVLVHAVNTGLPVL